MSDNHANLNTEPRRPPEGSTHKTILIASSLMGTQQIVRLAVGVVQAKIVAVLLGAGGTGIFGVYASVLNLGQSIFGLGLAGSGVRHIAASDQRDENGVPSRDIFIQVRFGMLLGLMAGLLIFAFRHPISRLTFGDGSHAGGIAWMAAATAVALMSTGLLTSLQGLRRIRDLTLVHISGAVLSALAAIALIYSFRENGVAPAFLAASACVWLTAWIFFRKIKRSKVRVSLRDARPAVAELIKLGTGFMSTSLFIALTAYAVRALLIRQEGLDAAGLYQAAWMLSTFYCTMVMRAMGTDFLPRISAAASHRDTFNRQVNEQTEVGLLLATPGLLLCMTAAVPVLTILYTSEFVEAVTASRWMAAGMMVRAAGWPLAYVPLALNKPVITLATEGAFAAVIIGLSAALISPLGLNGAGIAFFLASFIYTVVLMFAAKRLTGFSWSKPCRQHMVLAYGTGFSVLMLLLADKPTAWVAAWLIAIMASVRCGLLAFRLLKTN